MSAETRLNPAGDSSGGDSFADTRDGPLERGSPSDYVDLGAMILAEEPASAPTRITEDPGLAEPGEDFTAVLSRFRARLVGSLPAGDARMHHDLGTAYRTLGLRREAIGEYQQAIREDPASTAAYEMLGRCFLDAGQPDLAASVLARALALPDGSDDDLLGIHYYMGRAQEASGNPEAAYDFYRRTLAINNDFHDVEVRFRDLAEALRRPAGEPEDDAPGTPPDQGSPVSGKGR